MNLPNNSSVQNLIETFDLEAPEYYFEVQDYALEEGMIVIKSVKVFDGKGKFISLANNERLVNSIHKYPVSFKKK